jgi:hypothetical protein
MKAIPFVEQATINVDCNSEIYPIWANIDPCTAHPGDARATETGSNGGDASCEGTGHNKLALNYFPPSAALNDRQCRLIYKAKRPGWESVLFAIEVRNRVQGVIKESSRYSGQDESTSIYIGTTANAIRI